MMLNTLKFFLYLCFPMNLLVLLQACNPSSSEFICDPENLLNNTQRAMLTRKIITLPKHSACVCVPLSCSSPQLGPIIYVVILQDTDNEVTDLANSFLDRWDDGRLCKDQMVLVIHNSRNKIGLARGRDVKEGLRDSCVTQLVDKGESRLEKEGLDSGIFFMVEKISNAFLYGRPNPCKRTKGIKNIPIIVAITIGVLAFVVFVTFIFVKYRAYKEPPLIVFRTPYRAPHEPAEINYNVQT